MPATATEGESNPDYELVAASPPSRLRAAFLSKFFWKDMLTKNVAAVTASLAKDVCYYYGSAPGICGKLKVAKKLPYIGFPQGSVLANPVYWHCDVNSCLIPMKAWGDAQNYVLTTFGSSGNVTEVIVPLSLW